MIGASPRPVAPRRAGVVWAVVTVAACLAFVFGLSAQTTPASPPSDAPASPDATPAPPPPDAYPVLPPYAPSNNASSPLLPASPPLPPHPSVPDASLLPPGGTPPPVPSPAPLPVVPQTGAAPLPVNSNVPVANGAPAAADLPGGAAGATTTNNTGAIRRFGYAFRLTTGITYDDNVFLTSDQALPVTTTGQKTASRRDFSRADTLFVIEPAVSLGYGDFVSRATNYIEFDYNADVLLYAKNTDQDTVQHSLGLQGAFHFAAVTLTLSQGVQILDSTDLSASNTGSLLGSTTGANTAASQVNLDASRRTSLNIYTTRLGANYALSDKTSIDLDGYFTADDYETLISSDTISADVFFNYSPTGKITLGLGVSGGYVIQSDPAPDEFYEQINVRLSYLPTSKLSFSGSLGLEFRETSGVNSTDITPVFSLSASYAPFDSTSLSLAANRSTATSAVLSGQNFDTTGFTVSINQRLFQRANAHLSFGYTHSNYVYSGTGVSANRDDDYYFVQPGIDYTIRDNLSAGIFYVHRQSASSLSGNSFSDNQIGARLSLSF